MLDEPVITIDDAYHWDDECQECGATIDDQERGIYPYYGLAPHVHVGKGFIGSTVFKSEPLPKNFIPDSEAEGAGVYTHCLTCGAGKC